MKDFDFLIENEKTNLKKVFSELNSNLSNDSANISSTNMEKKNLKLSSEETNETSLKHKRIKVDQDISILTTLMMLSDNDIIRLLELNKLNVYSQYCLD